MEKDQDDRPNALVRQFSEGWSVQEAPESPGPSEDPLDFGKENQDIEKDGGNEDLSRVVSGPPYTIFGPRAKMFIVLSVSVSSLISPFGATTFYPALNVLAHQLHVTPTLMNLSLTTYMVSRPLYRIRVKEKAGLTLIRLHKLLHLRSLLALPTLVDADYRSSYASLSILPPISAWRFRRTMPRCWSFESSKLLVVVRPLHLQTLLSLILPLHKSEADTWVTLPPVCSSGHPLDPLLEVSLRSTLDGDPYSGSLLSLPLFYF